MPESNIVRTLKNHKANHKHSDFLWNECVGERLEMNRPCWTTTCVINNWIVLFESILQITFHESLPVDGITFKTAICLFCYFIYLHSIQCGIFQFAHNKANCFNIFSLSAICRSISTSRSYTKSIKQCKTLHLSVMEMNSTREPSPTNHQPFV